MLGISTADGFMNVKEGLDEMIKYLANEPSVGLYYVQQHAHTSMPYLLDVKEKVVGKIHEVTLHTEDVEDSIEVVRSMSEFGHPLAEEMIKDINKSLQIMSKAQPKHGIIAGSLCKVTVFMCAIDSSLIQNHVFRHQTIASNSSNPVAVGHSTNSSHQESYGSRGYFSSVLNSAKQRAAGFRWPQTTPSSKSLNSEQLLQPSSQSALVSHGEAEELPLSSSLEIGESPINALDGVDSHDHVMVNALEDYKKFNYDRESKYQAWLQETEEQCKFIEPVD